MVCTLWNYLGTGSKPHLYLWLGANGPNWDREKYKYIDYGQSGQIPWSSVTKDQWVSWDVKDENGNYYGTIGLNNSDGSHVSWEKYVSNKGHWLEGITLKNEGTVYKLACTGIQPPPPEPAPPIITNQGWSNGQGNTDSKPVVGESFWVQDYGMDEPGRWNPEGGAIYQSTAKLSGSSDNLGSRGYPIRVDKGAPTWTVVGGVGVAFEGLWQIDIKIGSDGTGNFCETFYLAERYDPTWGPDYYSDGMGGGDDEAQKTKKVPKFGNPPKAYSREIDIMETRWAPTGPAINLPTGGGTAWRSA
jgi:hypothetical protein